MVQVAYVALMVAAYDHLVEPHPVVLRSSAVPVLVGLEVHPVERRVVFALEAFKLLPVGVSVDRHSLELDYRFAYPAVAITLLRQVEDLPQLVEAEYTIPSGGIPPFWNACNMIAR